jgi:hypothetical protein
MRKLLYFGGNAWSRGFAMPPGGLEGLGVTSADAVRQGGASLLQVAKYTGPAAPFVAAAGALLEFISSAFLTPNYGKEYASAFVNQIEYDYMRPNLSMWQALPPERKTASAQAAALNVFAHGWNAIIQYCSNPALTSGGIHCVADRQRGGKYDWWQYFYDPIANDQSVIPDPVEAVASPSPSNPEISTQTTAGPAAGSNTSPSSNSNLFLFGGLALLAVAGLVAFGGRD